jgi:hypothetical protein
VPHEWFSDHAERLRFLDEVIGVLTAKRDHAAHGAGSLTLAAVYQAEIEVIEREMQRG